jgi:hypothetical protein
MKLTEKELQQITALLLASGASFTLLDSILRLSLEEIETLARVLPSIAYNLKLDQKGE